jgi:hypothetical protein
MGMRLLDHRHDRGLLRHQGMQLITWLRAIGLMHRRVPGIAEQEPHRHMALLRGPDVKIYQGAEILGSGVWR